MANELSGLFETRVIPAGVAAAQALQYTKASLRHLLGLQGRGRRDWPDDEREHPERECR